MERLPRLLELLKVLVLLLELALQLDFGIVFDTAENLYIANQETNHLIHKISCYTLAGSGVVWWIGFCSKILSTCWYCNWFLCKSLCQKIRTPTFNTFQTDLNTLQIDLNTFQSDLNTFQTNLNTFKFDHQHIYLLYYSEQLGNEQQQFTRQPKPEKFLN